MDDDLAARTAAAVAWVEGHEKREAQLAEAVGRVTINAADLEVGLTLLLEGVLGPRSVLATSAAPASKKIEWLLAVAKDRGVCSAETGNELKEVLLRSRAALKNRNSTVHALWIQLPDSRFGRLAQQLTGGTFKGVAVETKQITEVAEELKVCAGQLYDVRASLEDQWGGPHAPAPTVDRENRTIEQALEADSQ
ncbi:hypothetical protein ACFVTZ_13640 [Cellulosimicrobium cellulans]|uniref:hypothetical protein n=1 Tax=Cellulosimicrobium cellulans TaxID=1710 RepID=UPI0036E2690C